MLNGPNRTICRATPDRNASSGGVNGVRIDCEPAAEGGFGGIMHSVRAHGFRGKRVRFSARVKTLSLERNAALWMRIDRPDERGSAFDNMFDRPIKGTTGWSRYEIVLEVAGDAVRVSYGVFLTGGGTLWIDAVSVVSVATDVPTTNSGSKLPFPGVTADSPSGPDSAL